METASGRTTVVVDPLDAIGDIVLAHRWTTPEQLKRLRALVPSDGVVDPARWLRLLTDERLLDGERRAQLDAVLLQQKSLPKFRLLRKLGAGGMGTVWLARLDGHDDPLALKVINARLAVDSDFLGRFNRETKALQAIRHPHIAAVIDTGSTGGIHYLAMEYINGPSLGDMLKTHRALPEGYVLRIVRQVADGLGHVNGTAGLVHRDVKPENILVQRLTQGELFPEDDLAKLIDFGLVKNADDDEHLTQTGMTIGTPLYMSPEQVRGEKLDGRSDIYALGATMYHLLTGQPPFKGTSPGAIMSAHLTEPTPDPGQLVPGLTTATRDLVQMAMAKAVDARFRGFDALNKAIDEATSGLHEKDGSMKLLRKPLVIAKKPTAKKPGSGGSGSGADHDPASVSERIARKHVDITRESGRLTRPSGRIGRADTGPAKPGSSADAGAANALRALTERVVAPAAMAVDVLGADESAKHRPAAAGPMTAPLTRMHDGTSVVAPGVAAKRSAVFDEDPTGKTGFGMLPWTILVFAMCAAAAFAVVRFVL